VWNALVRSLRSRAPYAPTAHAPPRRGDLNSLSDMASRTIPRKVRVARWSRTIYMVLSLSYAASACTDQSEIRRGDIFAPDVELEAVFARGFFLEGPAVAPDGLVYFSAIIFTEYSGKQAGHVWRFDPRSRKTELFRSPSGMSNGIKFDSDGSMVMALRADFGRRCVIRTDMMSRKSVILAGRFAGRALNSPNDLAIDERGRIYFTDPRYIGHEPVEQPIAGVYRIDRDGSVHLVAHDVGKPNGIVISPDQGTLYVSNADPDDSDAASKGAASLTRNTILAYRLSSDGTASDRRTFVGFSGTTMGVDRMTVDADGNVYAARFSTESGTRGIAVFSPTGDELAFFPIPQNPTNVTFGRGEELRTLYVTSGKILYRLRVLKPGYHLP